ncbi:MAG: response regulator [Candidatus Omnitrophica bacterium]|nr:response regulator [Candidatus Omnitrophota bacterium]
MEGKRVLIIDDALFMRNLIKDIVIKAGFEVCGEAANALEGVEQYRDLKPDLVTLDIVMPKMEEMDGITAVKQITGEDPAANIIIVSALAERRLVEESLTCGAKDFVVKPFTAEKLLEVIAKVLGEGTKES